MFYIYPSPLRVKETNKPFSFCNLAGVFRFISSFSQYSSISSSRSNLFVCPYCCHNSSSLISYHSSLSGTVKFSSALGGLCCFFLFFMSLTSGELSCGFSFLLEDQEPFFPPRPARDTLFFSVFRWVDVSSSIGSVDWCGRWDWGASGVSPDWGGGAESRSRPSGSLWVSGRGGGAGSGSLGSLWVSSLSNLFVFSCNFCPP